MTLHQALEYVAMHPTYTIWRMPAWTPDVWSVTLKTKKELPDGAIIHEPPEPLRVTRMLF